MNRLTVILLIASGVLIAFAVLHDPVKHGRSEGPSREAIEGGALAIDSIRADRGRKREAIAEGDSYLPYAVREDSMLRRWEDRRSRPVRVFIPQMVRTDGYSPAFKDAVLEAFRRWERVRGVPVRFSFVPDTSGAEVVVEWTERLEGDRTGQALVEWDLYGWLRRGSLTLATRSRDRAALSTDAVYTVALHEIGHLLGLGHSDDARDLMHSTPGVHDLTARDRNTVALLYSITPGSLRDPLTP